MKVVRKHNEWFRPVALNNRKSCPTCKCKLAPNESIWSWGEYINAKWRTVKHFCKECFTEEVDNVLYQHAVHCGCEIELRSRGTPLPEWLALTQETQSCVPVGSLNSKGQP